LTARRAAPDFVRSMPAVLATNRRATVFALLASIAMSALEATVVGTAMPTVIADLGGIDRYGWVGAAYMLASTVSMPLYGKLADLYGRRPTLIFGIVLFCIGSFGSGAAVSMDMLIVARGIQGLGAGAMQPVAMTIVGDLYSLEERSKVQALFGSVWGISGIAGPILGGLIVATIGWPWVFWVNLPLGVIAIVMLLRSYHEAARPPAKISIDWLGALVLTAASIAILIGAERELPWLTIPLGIALSVAFILIERRATSPVLPLALVMRRGIAVASASSLLLGAAMMAAVMFVPLFAQGVLGASAPEAGATIAPMLVGWPIAAAMTSRTLTRIGFRIPVIVGSIVVVIGLSIVAALAHPGANIWALRGGMFVYGLGMGFTLTAQILAVQSSVEMRERGVATATNLFARSMGGALGAGALGAVFTAALGDRLPPETVAMLLDPHRRAGVSSDAVRDALSAGLSPIFVTGAALGVIALAVSFLYPRDVRREAAAPMEPIATSAE
jgi:EmrB/QacA subfamily drug resistance transporter